jgi:hypothetical protein
VQLSTAARGAASALAVAAAPTVATGPAAARVERVVDVTKDDVAPGEVLIALRAVAAAEVATAGIAVRSWRGAGDVGDQRSACCGGLRRARGH